MLRESGLAKTARAEPRHKVERGPPMLGTLETTPTREQKSKTTQPTNILTTCQH